MVEVRTPGDFLGSKMLQGERFAKIFIFLKKLYTRYLKASCFDTFLATILNLNVIIQIIILVEN